MSFGHGGSAVNVVDIAPPDGKACVHNPRGMIFGIWVEAIVLRPEILWVAKVRRPGFCLRQIFDSRGQKRYEIPMRDYDDDCCSSSDDLLFRGGPSAM